METENYRQMATGVLIVPEADYLEMPLLKTCDRLKRRGARD